MIKAIKQRIGDVLEIPVLGGHAYAIYTHKHPVNGELLRVYSGVFESAPDIDDLASDWPVRFSCFTPLRRFIAGGFCSVIANIAVPESLKEFPIFRTGNEDHLTGKVKSWWLWNGTFEWKVEHITEEELGYPVNGVWGAELVVKRIEEGWEQYGKAF